jgi:hypothetical protein
MSEQPAAPAPADPPLEQRVGKLETGQESLSGKLDTILEKLSGGGVSAPAPAAVTADPAPAPADMTEQMRQAVRDVQAETLAKTAPATPAPEITPREITVRGKEKLQRMLFGKDPVSK